MLARQSLSTILYNVFSDLLHFIHYYNIVFGVFKCDEKYMLVTNHATKSKQLSHDLSLLDQFVFFNDFHDSDILTSQGIKCILYAL